MKLAILPLTGAAEMFGGELGSGAGITGLYGVLLSTSLCPGCLTTSSTCTLSLSGIEYCFIS